jgi:hypothetical protein
VTSRPPDFERRTAYLDPNIPPKLNPRGTVGIALVAGCIALGALVAVWVGVVVFVGVVVGYMVWVAIDSRRILRNEQALDPSQPHAHLREEWEQAVRDYGPRSDEAHTARRLYEESLVRYVKQQRK